MAIDFPASPTTGQNFTSGNQLWTYNGTAWVTGYLASQFVRQVFTATAGQTSFTVTGGYSIGLVDVYQNGAKLVNGTDVTVTSGTTVVLATGASAGDSIEVVGVSNVGGLSYLPLAGGTLTGALSGTSATMSGNVNTTAGVYQVNGKQAVNGPAFSAYLSANQTVTASTFTKINLNAELFDTNSNFDSTTNYRFTPTIEGYYQFDGAVINGGQLQTICQIYKNGTAALYGSRTDVTAGTYGFAYASAASGLLYMNGTTDYVELYGFTSGTNFLGGTGASAARLTGFMARGA